VKLIPAALGMLAPLERNWRGLLVFTASAGLFFAIPWAIVAVLHGPKKPANTDYLYGTPCVLSWSIPSIALRILEPPDADGRLPNDWINGWDLPRLHLSTQQKLVSISTSLATLAMGLAMLWCKRRKVTADQIPIGGAALIALALAASPIAWWHYQAMQYPGVALLLYYAIRKRAWGRLASAIACAIVLFPLPAAVLRHYYHRQEQWPSAPGLMYFWTSVTPIASLVLFAMLVHALQTSASLDRTARVAIP
jgi:hypothetical protein